MRISRIAVLVLALAFGLAAGAAAQYCILCQGSACGGGGARAYQYDVSAAGGATFYHVHIGTDDPNIANYSNWLMPQGWSLIGISSYNALHDGFTTHGSISAPTGTCSWSVAFGGPSIAQGVFGFDHAGAPHDVGWEVVGSIGTQYENWSCPVGCGLGPVHGPTAVPEPATILVVAAGLAGILVRRRRP